MIQIPRQPGQRLAFAPFSVADQTGEFITFTPARYAKNQVCATPKAGGFFMGRAGRLAAALSKRRYSTREKGYIISPSKAERLQALLMAGCDANGFTDEIDPLPV